MLKVINGGEGLILRLLCFVAATATSPRTYWIPFDLQSQAGKSPFSIVVRNDTGIGGCCSFCSF